MCSQKNKCQHCFRFVLFCFFLLFRFDITMDLLHSFANICCDHIYNIFSCCLFFCFVWFWISDLYKYCLAAIGKNVSICECNQYKIEWIDDATNCKIDCSKGNLHFYGWNEPIQVHFPIATAFYQYVYRFYARNWSENKNLQRISLNTVG